MSYFVIKETWTTYLDFNLSSALGWLNHFLTRRDAFQMMSIPVNSEGGGGITLESGPSCEGCAVSASAVTCSFPGTVFHPESILCHITDTDVFNHFSQLAAQTSVPMSKCKHILLYPPDSLLFLLINVHNKIQEKLKMAPPRCCLPLYKQDMTDACQVTGRTQYKRTRV